MMIFSKDTEIARSSLAIIASFLASLLEARKSKCMACSIISSIGASSCRPNPALFFAKHHPHSGSTSQSCLTSFPAGKPLLKIQPVLVPSLPDEVYIGYRIT